MLIWSVATNPSLQGSGVGKHLLRFAEERARQTGLDTMRLYTETKLAHLIAWYGRHGFVTERIEELPDRSIMHMIKQLPSQ